MAVWQSHVRFSILCEPTRTSDVTPRPHFKRFIMFCASVVGEKHGRHPESCVAVALADFLIMIMTITSPYENAAIWTSTIFTSFHVLIYLLLATLGTFSKHPFETSLCTILASPQHRLPYPYTDAVSYYSNTSDWNCHLNHQSGPNTMKTVVFGPPCSGDVTALAE